MSLLVTAVTMCFLTLFIVRMMFFVRVRLVSVMIFVRVLLVRVVIFLMRMAILVSVMIVVMVSFLSMQRPNALQGGHDETVEDRPRGREDTDDSVQLVVVAVPAINQTVRTGKGGPHTHCGRRRDSRTQHGFHRLVPGRTRPELLESTYHLYKATGKDKYLAAAREIP